jgi:tripartite-type tricarboxylate transporter receptor subunit TctC
VKTLTAKAQRREGNAKENQIISYGAFLCGGSLRLCAFAVGVFFAVANSTAANAQAYPTRPLRMVVPFSPGGSADIIARILMQKTAQDLGQNIVIENRAGANSNIGAELVAHASPDGYTLLYNTSSIIFNMFLYPKLGYDTFRDFSPVALTAVVPQVLVVIPSLPARNLKEFIQHLRSTSRKLDYASVGHGNIGHLTTVQFLKANKVDAVHVPYKGAPAAYADLIGGRTQFYFATITTAVPFVRDNRLRPIAVTSLAASPALPEVPTLHEAGMAGFEAGAWSGVLAPARTPADRIKVLHAAITRSLKDSAVGDQLGRQGTMVLGGSSADYGRYLRSEHERWGKIIREVGVE